jgi:tetratricopeptide (TPR) repeat protein
VKAQLQANQSQQAADRLTAFLQKQPDKEMAHELLGEVRLVQKNSTAAIASFDRAIALNPRFWVAYRGKALALEASAKPDLALDTLKQGYAASAAADLGVDLSNRLDRRGDHDAAVKVYEDMHQRNPDSLPIANNLAMMLTNGRGDADSLARADKLGEMLAASTEPSYLDTRGWIKYRRGQFEQALPLLQQASEKSPQSREIRYHLGMAQYRSGDRAAARASLEAALAGNKDFSGVEEARATLADLRGKG